MWRFLSRLFSGWASHSTRPLNTLLSIDSQHFKSFRSSLMRIIQEPQISPRALSLFAPGSRASHHPCSIMHTVEVECSSENILVTTRIALVVDRLALKELDVTNTRQASSMNQSPTFPCSSQYLQSCSLLSASRSVLPPLNAVIDFFMLVLSLYDAGKREPFVVVIHGFPSTTSSSFARVPQSFFGSPPSWFSRR
jgi:hypothetical protein